MHQTVRALSNALGLGKSSAAPAFERRFSERLCAELDDWRPIGDDGEIAAGVRIVANGKARMTARWRVENAKTPSLARHGRDGRLLEVAFEERRDVEWHSLVFEEPCAILEPAWRWHAVIGLKTDVPCDAKFEMAMPARDGKRSVLFRMPIRLDGRIGWFHGSGAAPATLAEKGSARLIVHLGGAQVGSLKIVDLRCCAFR